MCIYHLAYTGKGDEGGGLKISIELSWNRGRLQLDHEKHLKSFNFRSSKTEKKCWMPNIDVSPKNWPIFQTPGRDFDSIFQKMGSNIFFQFLSVIICKNEDRKI